MTPAQFKEELMAGEGDVVVWINSPGGDCIAAAQIYNMLSEYPGKVTVKVDSLAASAASVIAMAGDEVLMSPVSMLMIHNPATMAFGDHTEMQKAIELLDAVKESIINAYVKKTGLSRARISHLMDAETWMDANKAVELGFADGVLYSARDGDIVEGYDEKACENPADDNEASGRRAGKKSVQDFRDPGIASNDAVLFSRRAVNAALVNKLEAHFGKSGVSAEKQAEIRTAADSATAAKEESNVQKMHDADGARHLQQNIGTDRTGSGLEHGRSADEIRERLNFIKKFI